MNEFNIEDKTYNVLFNNLNKIYLQNIDFFKNVLKSIEDDPPHPVDCQCSEVIDSEYHKHVISLIEKEYFNADFGKNFSFNKDSYSIDLQTNSGTMFLSFDVEEDSNEMPLFNFYMGFEFNFQFCSIIIMSDSVRYRLNNNLNYNQLNTFNTNYKNVKYTIDYSKEEDINEEAINYIFNNVDNNNIKEIKDIIKLSFDISQNEIFYEHLIDCILKERNIFQSQSSKINKKIKHENN